MKTLIMFGTIIVVSLCCGCSSGSTTGRSEYADPLFDSRFSKRAAREAEIRKLHPSLSEQQVQEKLTVEFPVGVPR